MGQTQTTHSSRIHLGLAARGLQSRNWVGVALQNSKFRPRLAIRLMLGHPVLRGPRRLPLDRRQHRTMPERTASLVDQILARAWLRASTGFADLLPHSVTGPPCHPPPSQPPLYTLPS